mgnify:CR=1 FL=1
MPLTGALKPIDQHMQEELMGGTDLPIQLLLSQIKPSSLANAAVSAQVVILGIDNDAVHVKDNGVERKCGHGTLPNKRTPASSAPNHALIGDSSQQLIQRHRNTIFVVIGGHHLGHSLNLIDGVAHGYTRAGPLNHGLVVLAVAKRYDIAGIDAELGQGTLERTGLSIPGACTQSTSRP